MPKRVAHLHGNPLEQENPQATFKKKLDEGKIYYEIAEWTIEYPAVDEKSNDEWITFFKNKLSVSEPILFGGYVFSPNGEGGHASLITGYKRIYGAEYLKIHDTWDKIPKWWRIFKNRSLTLNGSTYNDLIMLERENGSYVFFIMGRISNPVSMTVIQIPYL